ncbi:TetR/AcrR family transcriptional regulator C-terminal domain-containing protein [Streptomyces sp. AV19]|uniref:TetR/AcrR family transcriptional regulator n=1 Tax=Streptomyces sp. AV19 TaxID=2793068 RepID=UPI0018FE044A|nr:TetR/AcrR family transcriptional regulator C-terminal domain-containing protein [Streptomyces sp. AV19]MBH1934792.1 TetR/AcrR family transcriptional regulator C-terminal domain-containing protein [Streptomyces sp. AV19]MDG4530602.1 TetR/AcrR family transcriptional regulator C-terminal domain-containing protein [Streptomyces sp. AV19]
MASSRGARDPRISVWLTGEKASPRRRADAERAREQAGGLDREKIVATTVRLLDAEGLAGFSMRRLAAELGVTAMSVYWYVDNKDDLLELALDAAVGEMPLPDPGDEDADWRDQLRQLAIGYRRLLVGHEWVAGLVGRYLNIGPRAMRFSDTTLSVMRRSGVAPDRVAGSMGSLFQFVYGFATVEALYRERCRASGLDQNEYLSRVIAAVAQNKDFMDRHSASVELTQARVEGDLERMWEEDFAVGLDTVIAGIEAMRDRLREK